MVEVGNSIEIEKNAISDNLRRLWVVTELYYPEETSTGYYLTKIAEGLASDFDVKVLCGQPNYSARGVFFPKREIHKRVEIFRAFGTTLDKNIIVFRLINMLTLGIGIFIKALFNFRKGDQILVVTTPPSLPFITALAAFLRRAEYVLLIHDNYPEILIAVGKTSENSPIVKILDFLNHKLYKNAKKIIVVGRDMRELVKRKIENIKVPIEFISNWAELEQVEPAERDKNILLKELALLDKFVFLFAGNMGYPNDLESIVECAEKLKDENTHHFIFLGAGVKKKWLVKQVKERKLSNITVLEPRPRNEQNIFLNACDVALVSLVKKMRGVSMPSRTYNILAVGKPILALADKDSELAKVVEEDEVGWVVPPNAPDKLLKQIKDLTIKTKELRQMGIKARKSALKKYSLSSAIEKYRKALRCASDNE